MSSKKSDHHDGPTPGSRAARLMIAVERAHMIMAINAHVTGLVVAGRPAKDAAVLDIWSVCRGLEYPINFLTRHAEHSNGKELEVLTFAKSALETLAEQVSNKELTEPDARARATAVINALPWPSVQVLTEILCRN